MRMRRGTACQRAPCRAADHTTRRGEGYDAGGVAEDSDLRPGVPARAVVQMAAESRKLLSFRELLRCRLPLGVIEDLLADPDRFGGDFQKLVLVDPLEALLESHRLRRCDLHGDVGSR